MAQISRFSIFEKWSQITADSPSDVIKKYVLEELGVTELPKDVQRDLNAIIRKCTYEIEVRWAKAFRHKDRFLENNAVWLQQNINLPQSVIDTVVGSPKVVGQNSKRGRPQKTFQEISEKSQTKRIKSLLELSQEELSRATEVKLYKAGKRDSAAIVKELSAASPTRGTKLKNARKSLLKCPPKLSPDQALAMIVDANLSSSQYDVIRSQAKLLKSNLYPPYHQIREAKKLCYPSGIQVTPMSAEVPVKSLIDHTVTRLCKAQEDVLQTLSNSDNLTILMKWGCDGAEQSKYKQKFSEENCNDESLFSISMVPIQIYSTSNENRKSIIWQNPSPSSTRYCRPMKFLFAKETVGLINDEVKKIEKQIDELSPTIVLIGDKNFIVNCTMIFCMIDGKVCNAVSGCLSSQSCYLCGAKPTDMNKMGVLAQKVVNEKFLSFGLSPLHSWIRFFECILHISYKLDIKSWQARGTENKMKVANKKQLVQERFKNELGLLVDMPKQQTGNSNDGNTARRFFRNAQKSADITGVSFDLIKRFHIILECLNCGFPIDVDKFDVYARQTLELYLKEYPWYSMPVSVHKILFHGKDIISASLLPIGQYSEEAQEARNKECKKYRELFTRKTSRKETNTDLFNRLLITSDPYIASLRASPKTKHGEIEPEVLDLLKEPCIYSEQSEYSESSDSE